MNYKNAFKCKKCPQSNGENGCPAWWEWMAHTPETGEDNIMKMCGFQAMPIFLTRTMQISGGQQAAVEDMRNHLVEGFDRVAKAVEAPVTILPLHNELKAIK